MIAAYISLFVSLLVLVFFIIILIKFNKKFSTDKLVEKTQNYINKLVSDMNNNAMRDIDLVNQNSRQLRELLLQAENTMNSFNEATDRLRAMISETEKVSSGISEKNTVLQSPRPVHYGQNQNVAPLKTVSQRNKELLAGKYDSKRKKTEIDPEASFKITVPSDSKNDIETSDLQGSLFDNPDIIKVTSDGAAYKEVPVIHTKTLDEKPATNNYINIANSKRSLSDKVNELYAKGYPVEEIARQLNCSVTEVTTIIELEI